MAMGSALVDQYASKPIMSREDYFNYVHPYRVGCGRPWASRLWPAISYLRPGRASRTCRIQSSESRRGRSAATSTHRLRRASLCRNTTGPVWSWPRSTSKATVTSSTASTYAMPPSHSSMPRCSASVRWRPTSEQTSWSLSLRCRQGLA